MAHAAQKWIAENIDLISGTIKAAVMGVATAFRAVGSVISWVSDLIHDVMGGDTGATAILIEIATVIASLVVPALWSMVAPLVIAMAPLLALATGVALVAYAVLELIQHWDDVQAAVEDVVDAVRGAWNRSSTGSVVSETPRFPMWRAHGTPRSTR